MSQSNWNEYKPSTRLKPAGKSQHSVLAMIGGVIAPVLFEGTADVVFEEAVDAAVGRAPGPVEFTSAVVVSITGEVSTVAVLLTTGTVAKGAVLFAMITALAMTVELSTTGVALRPTSGRVTGLDVFVRGGGVVLAPVTPIFGSPDSVVDAAVGASSIRALLLAGTPISGSVVVTGSAVVGAEGKGGIVAGSIEASVALVALTTVEASTPVNNGTDEETGNGVVVGSGRTTGADTVAVDEVVAARTSDVLLNGGSRTFASSDASLVGLAVEDSGTLEII